MTRAELHEILDALPEIELPAAEEAQRWPGGPSNRQRRAIGGALESAGSTLRREWSR
jgi:hypothetical protein